MDERKLRLYQFLLSMERVAREDIPELYRAAVTGGEDNASGS
ncbi:hypothetical protein [Paenibacillus sp. BIHB 4019]|nr:hypothetical protein [Paenibacillus sp. BIHB 4019]